MRCLLLGQCKWTSDSTVSLLNVGLSISFSAKSPMGCWGEEHLQCSSSPYAVLPQRDSTLLHLQVPSKFCSPRESLDNVSVKVRSCKLHHAPRQQVTHQDIQPKTKHRQLLVVAWHCLNTAPAVFHMIKIR